MSDLIRGKVICFKSIAMTSLLAFISGLCFYARVGDRSVVPISTVGCWLFAVLTGILVFELANNKHRKEDIYLSFNQENLILVKGGKREFSERLENVTFSLASWSDDNRNLMPAIELKSAKFGQIRIGAYSEELEWVHYSRIFEKTHFLVENEHQWNQLKICLKNHL